MITQDLINRGGSKLEITRALLEAEVDIPIPRSAWKYFGQSLDSIKAEFEAMRKPVIVRGSHPNDYHGFIDVVPTRKNVYTFSELEKKVREIEDAVASDAVRLHSEDWGQSYTLEVHILIQEQGSHFTGVMIRHPHVTERLMIQYQDCSRPRYMQVNASVTGSREEFFILDFLTDIEDRDISALIEMYEKLEKSGILDMSYSQQVEFGLRPLMFYQARPFMLFQPAREFRVEIPEQVPHIETTEFPYGVTPEHGTELEFVVIDADGLAQFDRGTNTNPYGLILVNKHFATDFKIPVGNRLGNLIAFCSPCGGHQFLYHNNYRFMKKAQYSMIEGAVVLGDNWQQISDLNSGNKLFDQFRRGRILSNGFENVILPTNS